METREDGRSVDQLRALRMKCGVLSRSDGSCRFELSETQVLASVMGPLEETLAFRELADRARVQVTIHKFSDSEEQREWELEHIVTGILENVIQTRLYPRKVVRVTVQVINDDGSLPACVVLACSAALLDAGVHMIGVPSAACCLVQKDQAMLVDPSQSEVNSSLCAGVVFACTMGDNNHVVACSSTGKLSRSAFSAALQKCLDASLTSRSFIRLSFTENVKQRMALRSN